MSLCCQTCCQTKGGICEKHVRRSYDIHVGFSHAYLEEFKDACNDVPIA